MKHCFFFLCLMGSLSFLSPSVLLACKDDCAPADCPNRAMHHMESDVTMGTEETAFDPICGMEIPKAHAVAEVEYQGRTYYFCMEGEKEIFLKDPEKYLKKQAEPGNGKAQ